MEKPVPENHHPTSKIKQASLQLRRCLTVCSGLYAEDAQKEAVEALSGHLKAIVIGSSTAQSMY